jgi:hypothetical protein
MGKVKYIQVRKEIYNQFHVYWHIGKHDTLTIYKYKKDVQDMTKTYPKQNFSLNKEWQYYDNIYFDKQININKEIRKT